MLPERMKKGEYVFNKERQEAKKIVKVRKHPEYDEERLYALEGMFGIVTPLYENCQLEEWGYDECLTFEELNEKFINGEYNPSEVVCKAGKKLEKRPT